MKLRNKKTGELCELKVAVNGELAITKDDEITGVYSSLAELNEEWEDYEEPNKYWYVDEKGTVFCEKIGEYEHLWHEAHRAIGNYFETKEEAEKAVEKLKAWKRLKDRGFRFIDHTDFDDGNITIWGKFNKELDERDVDLLFGGEE